MGCLFSAISAFIVVHLAHVAQSYDAPVQAPTLAASEAMSHQKSVVIGVVWFLLLMIYSTPSILYALSLSIPGDHNLLNLSTSVLAVFQHSIGFLIWLITMVIIPISARTLVQKVTGEEKEQASHQSTSLILLARLFVVLLVPLVVLVIFGSDCYAGW